MNTTQKKLTREDILKMSLSEIVNQNFQTASVFEKYNLDFCCGGNKNISKVCEEKKVNLSDVLQDLENINPGNTNQMNFEEWDLDFLTDYIINNHHNYVRKMIPIISAHTKKIAAVHGKNHPELKKIADIFDTEAKELKQHMMKEEQILFPFIKSMAVSERNNSKIEKPFFGTVEKPIKMMENEHQNSGDGIDEIRKLSNNYLLPEDGCNTYKVTLMELKEFEQDLHKHVYLENYILFPKSIDLEKELLN